MYVGVWKAWIWGEKREIVEADYVTLSSSCLWEIEMSTRRIKAENPQCLDQAGQDKHGLTPAQWT